MVVSGWCSNVLKILKSTCIICLFTILISGSYAESLWEDTFKGHIFPQNTLEVGEIVSVVVDINSSLQLEASHIGAKSATLSIKGGATGDLLSFLPEIESSNDAETEADENLSFSTRLSATVEEIDENGKGYIRGTRTVSVNGQTEAVTITGWVSPKSINTQGAVPFTELTEAKLVYKSVLESDREVISSEELIKQQQATTDTDLIQDQTQETATSDEAAAEQGTAETEGEGAAEQGSAAAQTAASEGQAETEPTESIKESYNISDKRKKELLLQYINSFLDLMFD